MNKFLCTMEPICDQWRRQDRLQQLFHQADPTCTHSSHINGAVEGQVSDPSQHSDDNDLEIDINETDASHLTQVLDSSSKSKLVGLVGGGGGVFEAAEWGDSDHLMMSNRLFSRQKWLNVIQALAAWGFPTFQLPRAVGTIFVIFVGPCGTCGRCIGLLNLSRW